MNEKFSPGPWRFERSGISGYILDRDGRPVAGGEPHEGYMGEDDPNNVLMLAAPDLYAAVRDLLDEFVDGDPEAAPDSSVVAAAFKTLAKARGEEPPGT